MKIEPKIRICLGCNKQFKSIGTGNRICPVCQKNVQRRVSISRINIPPSKKTLT